MFHVQRRGKNVCQIVVDHNGPFEQRFLVTADRHWDHAESDWELQLKHLKQAVKYNAGIFDLGDFFDVMQGRYDKRSNKSSIRAEHKVDNYFDSIVDTASDFFEPYAKQFVMIAMGNHETKMLEKHEINITDRLVKELNRRTNSTIYNGGYSGWLHIVFHDQQTGHKTHKKIFYHHGYGGGGPVTKGVIQTNRRAVYTPDADLIVTGHVHEEWNLTLVRNRLDNNSRVYQDEQIHAQIGTYKNDYGDGFGGFHTEKGGPPKPMGGLWVRFFKEEDEPVKFDLLKAK